MPHRKTYLVQGRLAMREIRLRAARARTHGVQVMTFEQLAGRLAGGFSAPVDGDSLRAAIQGVLPNTPLGELDSIKLLPGMVGAAADTLRKAWHAGIDLSARAHEHSRLASVAKLEAAVCAQLPKSMLRPSDLVGAALHRIAYAHALFGSIDIVGFTELNPCWRPLLAALGARLPVRWVAGPRSVPAWLAGSNVTVVRSDRSTPLVTVISAATAYHEVIEALRWARLLLASGAAKPEEIAIAAATSAEYDDHFLALRGDLDFDLHFAHGVKVTATREGQAAAALADILLRGLSQGRIRRLAALLANEPGPMRDLPSGWMQILPGDAPLTSDESWKRLLDNTAPEDWPDGADHNEALRAIIDLLAEGVEGAVAVGDALLSGGVLSVWRKALLAGPPQALDSTLDALKQDDGLEACVSVAWMPANVLAASPRSFVRLLGLNSSRWPRGISEDRLLSDHIIPTRELDPLPVTAADRRDLQTILATTEREVVLSRSRRDGEGRLLGRSALLHGQPAESYVRRNGVPPHAMSECDRLLARPEEFSRCPQAVAGMTGWRNWLRREVTAHDGLVRPDHPLILAIIERTHSASSLQRLLRNPLGYVWHYGMQWRAPDGGTDPLVLDALSFGSLVHQVLEHALRNLEVAGGLAKADGRQVAKAVDRAVTATSASWEAELAIPPAVIWRHKLEEARQLALRALTFPSTALPHSRSYAEVPFGGAAPKSDATTPWDAAAAVEVPDTGLRINGYIDRLDVANDGRRALVRDYKTGKPPSKEIILDGGRELQRCLYAFATTALLGNKVAVTPSLLYLRDEIELKLEDPESTLCELSTYLLLARASLSSGNSVIGPDSGSDRDDLAFALPANAAKTYCKRKSPAVNDLLAQATLVWEAP